MATYLKMGSNIRALEIEKNLEGHLCIKDEQLATAVVNANRDYDVLLEVTLSWFEKPTDDIPPLTRFCWR